MLQLDEPENFKKIRRGICPYCERKLKPYEERKIIYITCRYCKIKIKTSDIRNDTIPKKFNEKIQEKKDKEHKEILTKYKHHPIPKKCPYCKSKSVERYPEDYTWECDGCKEIFEWKWYECHFHGEVTVAATSEADAISLAYKNTGDLDVDMVREVD